MESILEIIVTIVVGFFWLFGNTLFNKNQEDSPTVPGRKKKRGNDQASGDSEARQREIRESIRRKIEERRQQQSEPRPVVAFEPEPQEEVHEPVVIAEPVETNTEDTFSWSLGENPYGLEMQKRLQEIEATTRKAEALRSEVQSKVSDDNTTSNQNSLQENILTFGAVKSALKNPQNVRTAFIYKEILGKPIGLQNRSEMGSGI